MAEAQSMLLHLQEKFVPAAFIETPAGDLVAVSDISSVRHWPPAGPRGGGDHRARLPWALRPNHGGGRPMIAEKSVLFVASAALLGMVAVEAIQVDRAQHRAIDAELAAKVWEQAAKDAVGNAAKALDRYRNLVLAYQARVEAAVDDNAVCTSMLPTEQRRSFTGR